jgi:hypothetical protein
VRGAGVDDRSLDEAREVVGDGEGDGVSMNVSFAFPFPVPLFLPFGFPFAFPFDFPPPGPLFLPFPLDPFVFSNGGGGVMESRGEMVRSVSSAGVVGREGV